MFQDDEYGGNFVDERYIDKRNEWVYENAQKFLETIKSTLIDDVFSADIAFAMAAYLYSSTVEDSIDFFDTHNLSYNHAVCYLHHITNKYETEAEDAFDEHIEDDTY